MCNRATEGLPIRPIERLHFSGKRLRETIFRRRNCCTLRCQLVNMQGKLTSTSPNGRIHHWDVQPTGSAGQVRQRSDKSLGTCQTRTHLSHTSTGEHFIRGTTPSAVPIAAIQLQPHRGGAINRRYTVVLSRRTRATAAGARARQTSFIASLYSAASALISSWLRGRTLASLKRRIRPATTPSNLIKAAHQRK